MDSIVARTVPDYKSTERPTLSSDGDDLPDDVYRKETYKNNDYQIAGERSGIL